MCLRMNGHALVGDLGVITGLAVNPVGDNLPPAVGKQGGVRPLRAASKTVLLSVVIDAGVGVDRAVSVAVVGDGVGVAGPAGAVAGGGSSHQGRDDDQLAAEMVQMRISVV